MNTPVAFDGAQWTVCSDATTVTNAVETLRAYSHIAFDCEGHSLGESEGYLSIISLCAIQSTETEPIHVFLIDTLALDSETIRPVFDLLRSDEHTKVIFDGRKDWSELYHRYSVRLTRVLDLQLADIESRAKRGEGLQEQLNRLSPFCPRNEVQSQPKLFRMIHRLNGLELCAKEHNLVQHFDNVKPSESIIHHQLLSLEVCLRSCIRILLP